MEGRVGRLNIVELNDIPPDYLIALVSGGGNSAENPIGLRQHENPSARGLRLIEGNSTRYPLIDSVYDCYVGAGVRHRGAAVAMQLTAGAYAPPVL